MKKETVNIRVFKSTYKRLKLLTIDPRRTLMEVVDELSLRK